MDIIHYETRSSSRTRATSRVHQAVPGGEEVHRAVQRRAQVHLPQARFPGGRQEQGQGDCQGEQLPLHLPQHGPPDHRRRLDPALAVVARRVPRANGAGKSTFIKLLTGEAEPDIGTVWKHPNMRARTSRSTRSTTSSSIWRRPPTSIRWRFQTGEDKRTSPRSPRYTEEEER